MTNNHGSKNFAAEKFFQSGRRVFIQCEVTADSWESRLGGPATILLLPLSHATTHTPTHAPTHAHTLSLSPLKPIVQRSERILRYLIPTRKVSVKSLSTVASSSSTLLFAGCQSEIPRKWNCVCRRGREGEERKGERERERERERGI